MSVLTEPTRPDVERLLATREPAMADLARQAFHLIMSRFPDATVTVDDQNIGFGRGAGYQGLVFTIAPARGHVTLGIAGGAGLPDPSGLMAGSGKVHRHVKLRTPSDLEHPALLALLDAALARVR